MACSKTANKKTERVGSHGDKIMCVKLYTSGKEVKCKTLHSLQVFGMNGD